ncbi:MAG: hypothetical protein OXB94_00740 [Nitrospira sp.]|nr:hypothetical protein [Nitrospira sp.]
MAAPSEHHDSDAKRNPLIPVGLTVLAILVIPLGIYSFGPEGPIKKNHVVFSTGQHRVHFADGTRYEEYRGYCILQARDQLLVLESAEDRTDGSYLARTLGTRQTEFPACPSQARVILYEHQITLRPDTWGGLQDALGRFLSS